MSQTLAQKRALAIHNACQRKKLAEARERRIAALKEKIRRQCVIDVSGWAFAFMAVGASLAVVWFRV